MLKLIRCCFPLLLCVVGTSAYVDTIYSQPSTISLQGAPNTHLTFSKSGRHRTTRTPLSNSSTSSLTTTLVEWAYSNPPGRAIVMGQESASAAPTETVLYSFQAGSDGAFPFAGLIADSSGNLYGTTAGGEPRGTVFKLSPNGIVTVLHAFTGASMAPLP